MEVRRGGTMARTGWSTWTIEYTGRNTVEFPDDTRIIEISRKCIDDPNTIIEPVGRERNTLYIRTTRGLKKVTLLEFVLKLAKEMGVST